MIRNKIITNELKKQGIRASDYHKYLLRNPKRSEKLHEQASISLKIAISAFAKILKKRGHYHV